MKNNREFKHIGLISLAILFFGVCVYFTIPVVVDIWTSLQKYNDRVTAQSDYTKITTPLSREVVDDICSKFILDKNDSRCLPNSVVYSPEFFADIKIFFGKLKNKDINIEFVQGKLGIYQVGCVIADNLGGYSCEYDLRGDGIYTIELFFTKDGIYYDIIANTGGS